MSIKNSIVRVVFIFALAVQCVLTAAQNFNLVGDQNINPENRQSSPATANSFNVSVMTLEEDAQQLYAARLNDAVVGLTAGGCFALGLYSLKRSTSVAELSVKSAALLGLAGYSAFGKAPMQEKLANSLFVTVPMLGLNNWMHGGFFTQRGITTFFKGALGGLFIAREGSFVTERAELKATISGLQEMVKNSPDLLESDEEFKVRLIHEKKWITRKA